MGTKYFAEEAAGGLEDVCYPEGRNPHERKRTLHFGNAPIQNTRSAGTIGAFRVQKGEHLAHGSDLAWCNFFLFGYMKEQLKGALQRRKSFHRCFLDL
jgi:hypothetical protein